MTTQPKDLMTLEETAGKLKAWQFELARASRGESMWGSVYFEALSEHLGQALHHLEMERKDAERYRKLRAHAEAEFVQIEGHGFDGYFEEGKDLDAALDCLPEPTAQEVKG